MAEPRWTPGPWRKTRQKAYLNPHVYLVVGPAGEAVAETSHWLDSDPIEESAANARLLAAAPDLYKALGLLLSFHESVGSPSPACPCEMARAALAKARGETP